MTNKDKRRDEQQNDQNGGKPRPSKPSAAAQASKALRKPKQGAIEKPTAEVSAESMSVDLYGDKDVEMKLLRRSMREKAKPQAFVPDSFGPKKSRGPLPEEQKAARKAAREAAQAAADAAKQDASRALPDPEALAKAREEQEIVALAQRILNQKKALDSKLPFRAAKGKVDAERQWKLAYEEAKKQYASQKKAQKQAIASEADILADNFGRMTTTRLSAPQSFGTHSSGHAIVGYDPKDGWPLGVNPVTGQVERFATREGGKKKQTYKKKAQNGGQGEFENAVAEDSKSQPASVSGGKKKRVNKKASKKGGVGEQPQPFQPFQPFGLGDRGAVYLRDPYAQPPPVYAFENPRPAAPVAQQPPAPPGLGEGNGQQPGQQAQGEPFAPQTPPQSPRGGKKKRTNNKKKSQKGGEVEGAVAEDSKSQAAPVSGGKKKRTNKKNN